MATVSVLLVRPIVAAIGTGALDALWAATDLAPAIVADDNARITAAQHAAAWREAIRLTGDRALALRAADATQPGAFGIAEQVWRAAPTLGEALRQWVRYLDLVDDAVAVGLVVEEDRAVLRVERDGEPSAPAAHELRWALAARHARELPGAPVRPLAVELAHPAPDDDAPYQAWFGAPVAFGAERTQLVLPRSALAAALAAPAQAPLAILARAADELAAATAGAPPTTARVARALPDALRSDDAQIEAVAKQLGLAGRTLQRRLHAEGTSFQVVREDVRRRLAERYAAAGLAAVEIAFLLGYAESAAYARALKRWA